MRTTAGAGIAVFAHDHARLGRGTDDHYILVVGHRARLGLIRKAHRETERGEVLLGGLIQGFGLGGGVPDVEELFALERGLGAAAAVETASARMTSAAGRDREML